MNKSFFQSSIRLRYVLLLVQMFSCTKTDSPVNGERKNSTFLTDQSDNQEEK
ncbi:hypothetical protein M2372_000056 [Chryseobacterium sp. BIGb0232]|nr:hypothetical protein [Chryseobacterium sp. BIGb0232]ROS20490.1 hypothetical protein EDF65_1214 [Chryseobacterium nakagawai]